MNVKYLNQVVVYCASSSNVQNIYLDSAYELGKRFAEEGISVIYGGGKAGLMGKLADGALSAGGRVHGIIPEFMIPLELGNNDVTELEVVHSMHQRQYRMIEESDMAVVLPGGSGTMLEFLEIISWKRLGLAISPVILLNLNGYYDDLLKMMEKSINEEFMAPEYRSLWIVTNSVEETVSIVRSKMKNTNKRFLFDLI